MRPVLKLALVLFVLAVCGLSYFGLKILNEIKAGVSERKTHDSILLANINTAFLSYITEYNRLPPITDNQKITASLLGKNSRHIAFISLSKDELNANNEVIDRWGTPFKMTYLENSGLQITSAGPDKIFGTMDDIVTNPTKLNPLP